MAELPVQIPAWPGPHLALPHLLSHHLHILCGERLKLFPSSEPLHMLLLWSGML